MKKLIVLSAFMLSTLAAGLALAADSKADAIKKDLKEFEGKWKMEKMESGGTAAGNADQMGALIDGNEFTFTFDSKARSTAKLTIDPTQTPKTMDILWTSGAASGNTSLAIYRLTEDGNLEICWNQARGKGSDKRPKVFTTKVEIGAGSVLYVLKKAK